MMPASHPSHTLWKSLRDSHIPTASATGHMSSCPPHTNRSPRKGLVTDVSGPQRNACPGTLISLLIAFPAIEKVAKFRGAARFGLDPGTALPGRVMADVSGVSAGEIGDPVMLFVLMKSDDLLVHWKCFEGALLNPYDQV